jgi:PP-loop superfamily ATP-utilizing enzyme
VHGHGDEATGRLARIELPEEDLARALAPEMRAKITAAFKELGFRFVTIELGADPEESSNKVGKADSSPR